MSGFDINWRYFSHLHCTFGGHSPAMTKGITGAVYNAISSNLSAFVEHSGGDTAPLIKELRAAVKSASVARKWIAADDEVFAGLGVKTRRFPGSAGVNDAEIILTPKALILPWPYFKETTMADDLEDKATDQGVTIPDLKESDFDAGPRIFLNAALRSGDYITICSEGDLNTSTDGDASSMVITQASEMGHNAGAVLGGGAIAKSFQTFEAAEGTHIQSAGESSLVLYLGRQYEFGLAPKGDDPAAPVAFADYPCGAITGNVQNCP